MCAEVPTLDAFAGRFFGSNVIAAYREFLVLRGAARGGGGVDVASGCERNSLSCCVGTRFTGGCTVCGCGDSDGFERVCESGVEVGGDSAVVSGGGDGRGSECATGSVRVGAGFVVGEERGVSQSNLCGGNFTSSVVDGAMGVGDVSRGKHWRKNLRKREKRNAMQRMWRLPVDSSGNGLSGGSAVSVATVDTCAAAEIEAGGAVPAVSMVGERTAEELQAAQTLAIRRVAENRLATVRANAQILSYGDKAKTEALRKLAAVRVEQRINEAKAKSQASYKKCDESLKSLGSTGSAGEFAMKVEIRKARESEKMLKYVSAQATMLLSGASPEMIARLETIPKPVYTDVFEDFGDCGSDCSPEEVDEYYRKLNEMNEEESARFMCGY